MRYELIIIFKTRSLFEKPTTIVEKFKTLKEAKGHEDMIDDTVREAHIKDMSNNTIKLKLK